MKKGVTLYILIGLLAGIIVGVLLNAAASDPADLKGVTTVFDTITTVFLRLVPSLPVVRAVALLNLLGALTLGWCGRSGAAFGRAMVAWNRAMRLPEIWSVILPTAASYHELTGEAAAAPPEAK